MSEITGDFERIGARARLVEAPGRADLRIDVRTDGRGEFFELRVPEGRAVTVLDVRPAERHLVLMATPEKDRFLCGHDERAWFVAALPERPPVTTVAQARDALKPPAALAGERRLARKYRNRRRNPAYVRQGEWFFLPTPELRVEAWVVLRDEPLSRGRGSTPHVAQEAVRMGGETVYVSLGHPTGLLQDEYDTFLRRNPEAWRWNWRVMRRDPEVYVRGRVTHPDHGTVTLREWHRALMNREPEAPAAVRATVVFLD